MRRGSGWAAVTLTTVLLVALAGCSGDGSGSDAASSARPEASSSTTDGSESPEPPEPSTSSPPADDANPVVAWDGDAAVVVDGVRTEVPPGYQGGHLRTGYAFLGYGDGGVVDWLAVLAMPQLSLAPQGTTELRPTPHDLYRHLRRSDEVEVDPMGQLQVAGATAPVARVDGTVMLCPEPASQVDCRWNTPSRFYVFVPYRDGTVVVEGESRLARPGHTPADDRALLDELRPWTSTITLP